MTATTSEEPVTNFTCGAGPGEYELDNQEPLLELKPGDIFKAGDIEVRAFDIQGSNGIYTGIGHAKMPWLRHVSLRVEFSSIFINSDYQMLRGVVKTIFNPDSKLVVDLDGNDELSGDENSDDEASEDTDVEITYDGEISDVHIDTETGEIIVTDEDGTQTAYPVETDEETGETKSVKVVDSSGDTWIVGSDGKVTKGSSNSGNNTPDGGSQHQFTIEEKIVIAVLEDFKTRMEAWLEVHGKGPLSDYEMMWAEGLPGCLPEEPETVEGAQEYVTYLLEDKENRIPEFTAKMKDSPEWETITGIGKNISDASEMSGESMDNAGEAVCPYILDEAINAAQCTRCPKPDYVGIEGEEAVTFDPDPVNVRRRGAKRWYYFAGYSQSPYYTAPESITETGAGWYAWDDYVKHVELIIESVAIASGDVALHPSNADDIIEYRERILEAFNTGREVSDNFKKLITKEYSRVTKEAFNKYSGSGYLEPVYPIYEILGLFSGKQLIKGLVKFGNAFRALKNARGLLNYNFSGNVMKIFNEQGDEIAKVMGDAIDPVKFLDEGEEIAEIGGYKLLKQGDEIGFKAITGGGNLVKDAIESKVVKQISYWDKNLNKLVEVPKYNNVALGKSMGGKLEEFGKEVGANVWTDDTHKIFTKMYDLPDSYSFERSIKSVLNETVNTNGGKILFDITGVNIEKSIKGGLVHTTELALKGEITELELQMLLRESHWFENVIFHEGGNLLTEEKMLSKGLKLIIE